MNDECFVAENFKLQALTFRPTSVLFAESETWPQAAQVAGVFITRGKFYTASNISRTPSPRVHVFAILEQVRTNCGRLTFYDQLRLHLLQYLLATRSARIAGLAAPQTSIQDLLKL